MTFHSRARQSLFKLLGFLIFAGCPNAVLCSSGHVWGQELGGQGEPDNEWIFGYELFQLLMEEQGLNVLPKLGSALAAPNDSVVIIIGSPPRSFSATDWGNLIRFTQAGGTLLVACEDSIEVPLFGTFVAGPVTTRNPREQYRGYSDCLRISPAIETEAFAGIHQIITNRTGWFAPNPIGWLNWEAIALLPADCFPLAARQQSMLTIGRAVGSTSGLAVVSADSSLFSNGMLWHGDNAIVAIRVSQLLCATSKRQFVFITDRQVQGSYRSRIQLSEPPPVAPRDVAEPSLQKVLRLSNAIAKEIAESNVLNEALRQRPRNVPPRSYLRALLYTLALSLLGGVFWVLVSNRAIPVALLAPRRMRASFEARENSGVMANDFRNAAGYLAREFCYELTGSRQSADWQKYSASLMTREVKIGRDALHELTKIVDIACRGCHTKMTSQQFQLFGNSIGKLRDERRTTG